MMNSIRKDARIGPKCFGLEQTNCGRITYRSFRDEVTSGDVRERTRRTEDWRLPFQFGAGGFFTRWFLKASRALRAQRSASAAFRIPEDEL